MNIQSKSTKQLYQAEISSREQLFFADEPIEKGGQNTAVTPMELLGGALASCTQITLQMYFNHKAWNYLSIEVDVNFEYTSSPIVFERVIKINADLDDKQIDRVRKIANACPVHKVLEKGNEIKTQVLVI